MLFLGLAGASCAPYATIETSLAQPLVPGHLRGRVFGAQSTLLTAAAPLGAVAGGVLLDDLTASRRAGVVGDTRRARRPVAMAVGKPGTGTSYRAATPGYGPILQGRRALPYPTTGSL